MSIGKHIEEHIILGGIPKKSQALGYGLSGGTIVLFGDSLTAQGDVTITGGATGANPTYTRNACSAFHRANWRLGCPFTRVINEGTGGDTTTIMANRFAADVLSYAPDWLMIMGGINDVTGLTGPLTPAQVQPYVDTAWTNLTGMYSKALNAGIKVIVCTCYPWKNTSVADNMAVRSQYTAKLNRKIREYAAETPGVVLFDGVAALKYWDTVAHDKNTEPDPQFYSSGLVHLNALGGQVLEPILTSALSPVIKRSHGRNSNGWDGTTGDVDNGLINSAFIGTTGTTVTGSPRITGNIATSWVLDPYYVALTSATTVVAAKTTHWNTDYSTVPVQRVTITRDATAFIGGEDFFFSIEEWVALKQILTLSGSQFAVGDTVFVEAEVNVTETSGTAASTMILVEMYDDPFTAVTGNVCANAPAEGTGTTLALVGGKMVDSVIRTPNFAIPASTELVKVSLFMLASVSSEVQWDWARPQLCKAVNT